jgi:Holliday junction resolvase RusA-like endonuclease
MKYETILDMSPPIYTMQNKGERVVRGKSGKLFVHHFTKKKQQSALDEYVRRLNYDIKRRANLDGIGTFYTFTTAIKVEIDFLFPHPCYIKKRDRGLWLPKVTRPDVDNMAKGLLDCITRVGLIQDDGLIFDLRLRKLTVPQKFRGVRIYISDEDVEANQYNKIN